MIHTPSGPAIFPVRPTNKRGILLRCAISDLWSCVLCLQVLTNFLKFSKEKVLPSAFNEAGWGKYILCPPVDDPRNLVDMVLSAANYKV